MRTFSFGAGVQSTAVLVLQAEGQLVLDLDGPDGCDTGSCFT